MGTAGLHTHLGPNAPASHTRPGSPPGPEPGPRPTGPQPSSGQPSSPGLPPPTGQTRAGGKRLSRAQTTLVVRMCSMAGRRPPAARLTDVPSGERTWAATATQTQQELSPWARATARQLAPGSVHGAGAAGLRRLLETLPQTRQRPRGVGGRGGASAEGGPRLVVLESLRILQRLLPVEGSPTLTEGSLGQ